MQSRQIQLDPIPNVLLKRGIKLPQASQGQFLASKFSVRKTRNNEIIFILGVAICTCSHFLRDTR